jgi:hypothetical protein
MDMAKLYERVFDNEGNIKACGREACKELILACEAKTGEVGKYGDSETGWMNPDAIKALYSTIKC